MLGFHSVSKEMVSGKYVSMNWGDPLSANPTKWSNTLKQFVDNLPTNCLSAFDEFVESELKGLKTS